MEGLHIDLDSRDVEILLKLHERSSAAEQLAVRMGIPLESSDLHRRLIALEKQGFISEIDNDLSAGVKVYRATSAVSHVFVLMRILSSVTSPR